VKIPKKMSERFLEQIGTGVRIELRSQTVGFAVNAMYPGRTLNLQQPQRFVHATIPVSSLLLRFIQADAVLFPLPKNSLALDCTEHGE
jgi:hypothetical protein